MKKTHRSKELKEKFRARREECRGKQFGETLTFECKVTKNMGVYRKQTKKKQKFLVGISSRKLGPNSMSKLLSMGPHMQNHHTLNASHVWPVYIYHFVFLKKPYIILSLQMIT